MDENEQRFFNLIIKKMRKAPNYAKDIYLN